jgi:hypothetical protein
MKLRYNSNSLTDIAEALDTAFPLQNPTPLENLPAIQRRAGQRDVVEYIQRLITEEDAFKLLKKE